MSWATHLATANAAVLAGLGGSVVYAPAVGSPVTVQGIFDAAYQRVDAGLAGVSASGPAVFLRLADLPTDPEDDDPTVTVDGVEYSVAEPRKDGVGGVVLMLRKVDADA